MEPGPPALGVQSLTQWTTREVLSILHLKMDSIWMFASFFLKSEVRHFFQLLIMQAPQAGFKWALFTFTCPGCQGAGGATSPPPSRYLKLLEATRL